MARLAKEEYVDAKQTAAQEYADAAVAGVGSPSREIGQIVTEALATGAQSQGSIALYPTTMFLKIDTDKAARVRFYETEAAASADYARPVGTDPADDSGLVFEIVMTAALAASGHRFSPIPIGSNFDPETAGILYCLIRNDGAAGPVTVDLTILRLESLSE